MILWDIIYPIVPFLFVWLVLIYKYSSWKIFDHSMCILLSVTFTFLVSGTAKTHTARIQKGLSRLDKSVALDLVGLARVRITCEMML